MKAMVLTGADGGYAEAMVVSEDFAYPIPSVFSDLEAAPLLCAGAVGYRSLKLAALESGGRLVVNAIGKEDADKSELLRLDYAGDLWMEKSIVSTANVTRADAEEFLKLAAEIPLRPEVTVYPLEDANRALREIRERKTRGAKVLKIG